MGKPIWLLHLPLVHIYAWPMANGNIRFSAKKNHNFTVVESASRPRTYMHTHLAQLARRRLDSVHFTHSREHRNGCTANAPRNYVRPPINIKHSNGAIIHTLYRNAKKRTQEMANTFLFVYEASAHIFGGNPTTSFNYYFPSWFFSKQKKWWNKDLSCREIHIKMWNNNENG